MEKRPSNLARKVDTRAPAKRERVVGAKPSRSAHAGFLPGLTGNDQLIDDISSSAGKVKLGHESLASILEPAEMSIDSVQIAEAPSKRVTVKFGSVTVHGFAPPDDEVAGNIKAGHAALSRVLKAFAKPGITLPRIKDVPLFSADPDDPITLIRELNGQSERGSLVDGKFKPY